MALLWCDGFDHYGATESNMTDGPYAEIGSSVTLSTGLPRTGNYSIIVGATGQHLRRVFGGAKTTAGVGYALYMPSLPSVSDEASLFEFRDQANSAQVSIVCQSTGDIAVKRGSPTGTLLGSTTVPALSSGAYNHVEALVTISDTVGSVEVRVNEVSVLSVSGVDTANTSNIETSQVLVLGGVGGFPSGTYIDDLFGYDDTGSYNNTFIGDKKVFTLVPDADTATADWSWSSGPSGYLTINELDPNGDTNYLFANTAGPPMSSVFTLSDLPTGVAFISGVMTTHKARKTDAGAATVVPSVVSGASESTGASHPMTTAYTYYSDVFEVDPATLVPFTKANVDGLQIKVNRTV